MYAQNGDWVAPGEKRITASDDIMARKILLQGRNDLYSLEIYQAVGDSGFLPENRETYPEAHSFY